MTVFGVIGTFSSAAFQGPLPEMPSFLKEASGAAFLKNLILNLPFRVLQARLMTLPSGGIIREHTDPWQTLKNGLGRLNIVVEQPPGTVALLDGARTQWQEGEIWWADFSLPHSVSNGDKLRINLVVDFEISAQFRALLPLDAQSECYVVPQYSTLASPAAYDGALVVDRQFSQYFGGHGHARIVTTENDSHVTFGEHRTAIVVPVDSAHFRLLGCPPALHFTTSGQGEKKTVVIRSAPTDS